MPEGRLGQKRRLVSYFRSTRDIGHPSDQADWTVSYQQQKWRFSPRYSRRTAHSASGKDVTTDDAVCFICSTDCSG